MTSRPARLLEDGSVVVGPKLARVLGPVLRAAIAERERVDRCRASGDVWEVVYVLERSPVAASLKRSESAPVVGTVGSTTGMITDTQTAADRAGLSPRRVQQLAAGGQIPGAFRIGRSWAIPADWEA